MKTKHESWIAENCSESIMWAGLERAIIGTVSRNGEHAPIVVYDRSLMLNELSKNMPFEEAIEWLSYNIEGAFLGPLTPFIFESAPRVKRKARGGVASLRTALEKIAENNDEPYARDFALDVLRMTR